MKITDNFSLEEFTKSTTAIANNIDNTPTAYEKENIIRLVREILQPIRDKYGKAITVTSGYRSPVLNRYVKGSSTSQHLKGEAADITSLDNKKLWDIIVDMINNNEITVGQLIWEKGTKKCPSWIHISLPYRKTNEILYLY